MCYKLYFIVHKLIPEHAEVYSFLWLNSNTCTSNMFYHGCGVNTCNTLPFSGCSRFCLYPQDIVVQLEQRVRLRKIQILAHQYLIRKQFFSCSGNKSTGLSFYKYSSPPLIKPPCLPRNWGHIRGMGFGYREVNSHSWQPLQIFQATLGRVASVESSH